MKNIFRFYLYVLHRTRLLKMLSLSLLLFLWSNSVLFSAPIGSAKIIRILPHDKNAYTQGLIIKNNFFYESTGLYGRSSIRKVDLETGKVLLLRALDSDKFGEGLTLINDKLYQLTWKSGLLIQYNVDTLEKIKSFSYQGEGWGLTFDEKHLILSDGTNILKFFDPNSLKQVKTISVHDNKKLIFGLNELEFVNSEIWANVWQTSFIVCINPTTGKVLRWIDLSHIDERKEVDDVLNGIAWDKEHNKIYVTGKFWKNIYEISID